MNLDEQLKILTEEAPKHGLSSEVMEKAVNPVLKLFAERLQHLEYYILQNLDEKWLMRIVSNRDNPQERKHTIYALPTFQDAGNFQREKDAQIIALPIPVTHILFQASALKLADSIIFIEKSGNYNYGTEIRRLDLQNAIQMQIQQLTPINSQNIPPDLA